MKVGRIGRQAALIVRAKNHVCEAIVTILIQGFIDKIGALAVLSASDRTTDRSTLTDCAHGLGDLVLAGVILSAVSLQMSYLTSMHPENFHSTGLVLDMTIMER
jgi:hypothetical protein